MAIQIQEPPHPIQIKSFKELDTYLVQMHDFMQNVYKLITRSDYKGDDVASSNDLKLGIGDYFDVTGTTTINGIFTGNIVNSPKIALQFDSSVTVKHNTVAGTGYASILLSGSADFSATASDVLVLLYDETTWRELSRTVI